MQILYSNFPHRFLSFYFLFYFSSSNFACFRSLTKMDLLLDYFLMACFCLIIFGMLLIFRFVISPKPESKEPLNVEQEINNKWPAESFWGTFWNGNGKNFKIMVDGKTLLVSFYIYIYNVLIYSFFNIISNY